MTSKRCIVFFFILYQHITVYSSAIKFTRLIPGNVCVQAEGMLKPTKALVLIHTMPKESYKYKNKIVILSCQRQLLGENYTEIKVDSKSLLSLIPTSTEKYTEIKV